MRFGSKIDADPGLDPAMKNTIPEDDAYIDRAALSQSEKALATFESFSYRNRKESVEWVTEAERQASREKRLATAVAWMAEGKPRNWKYAEEWR